ncbi:aliphatic sulfonate ABC transporter substrate-binding protein [Acidisphaera sp. S103]|uniref:aliphatic sulfonate ABC transporter substrate-binding protein n=1 Tax=Acidisphaera sp. S103 TaxID=1747223 RepID=UPI00131C53FB|nr:aliphatic sulfonate ABC transporter substrate-binding protein [Acidisphaera sp. S103]
MKLNRRTLLAAGLTLPAIKSRAAGAKTVRVGIQKGEPVLMAARENKDLEKLLSPKGIGVEWIEFQFGPPLLEAMRVGGIDVGAVGDTPPVFAQAAHGDLLYIGSIQGAPQSILLPAGSKIQTIADLKGKKIAFGRGSAAHNMTLMTLEKAGLRYDQIQPIYLGPADASAAFERGAIDAWTIWEPYASLFDNRPGVRTLTTNAEIGEQYGYIMGNGAFVRANPALAALVLQTCATSAAWSLAHRPEVAKILAGATGMPQEVWGRALAHYPYKVSPMTDDLVRSQQKVADRFRALGLVPVDFKVSDIVWHAGV